MDFLEILTTFLKAIGREDLIPRDEDELDVCNSQGGPGFTWEVSGEQHELSIGKSEYLDTDDSPDRIIITVDAEEAPIEYAQIEQAFDTYLDLLDGEDERV